MVQASMDVSSNVHIHGWAQLFGYGLIFDLPSSPLPAHLPPTPLSVRHPKRPSPATNLLQCVSPRDFLAALGGQSSQLLQASQEEQEAKGQTQV